MKRIYTCGVGTNEKKEEKKESAQTMEEQAAVGKINGSG